MAGETPDVATLTKVYFATSLNGTRTPVAFTESIPALEEAPDQVTAKVLDLDYELARPDIKKASKLEIPILYTMTQHKSLRDLDLNTQYFWFFVAPENTAIEAGKPLVRYLQASAYCTMDEVKAGDFIKDKLTLYKTTDVQEMDGLPTTQSI